MQISVRERSLYILYKNKKLALNTLKCWYMRHIYLTTAFKYLLTDGTRLTGQNLKEVFAKIEWV